MTVDIRPGKAAGTVLAPPSKSVAHRLLICAGLSEGQSVVRNVAFSEDILATLDVLKAMGARIETSGNTVTVAGCDARRARYPGRISCRESGSTLRFFVPLLALSGTQFLLTGQGRLMERPQTVYETLFHEQGLIFQRTGDLLKVQGPLSPGHYTLRGDISSQFFTGLLLALPLLGAPSRITLLPPVESRSYIDLTLDAGSSASRRSGRRRRNSISPESNAIGGSIQAWRATGRTPRSLRPSPRWATTSLSKACRTAAFRATGSVGII